MIMPMTEQQLALRIMEDAKVRYAGKPKRLQHVTPERCLRVARQVLASRDLSDEEKISSAAIDEENKVCGGIILTIIVQIVIKLLVSLAVNYILRERANGPSGNGGTS